MSVQEDTTIRHLPCVQRALRVDSSLRYVPDCDGDYDF